ncbi:MAG: alpha/beta hydrolase [Enhygromyxa sp.]
MIIRNLQLAVVRKLVAASVHAAKGLDLAGMRAQFDRASRLLPKVAGVASEAVDAGGVPAEWLRPEGAEQGRAILYLHGGGFVMGSIESHRTLAARVAIAARAPVLAINYRLAPEHPFPAGLDDALLAYRWLTREVELDPPKLALVGDSAGGGLAISAALRIRGHEDLEPCGAIACMSAWVDLTCSAPSLSTADDPTMEEPYVRKMAQAYLAGEDPRTPEASPLFADLRGLPPILLQAGGAEALRDDSQRFAERCEAAGVEVTLQVWDEMFHGFQAWAMMLDDGKRAIEQLGAFVRSKTS